MQLTVRRRLWQWLFLQPGIPHRPLSLPPHPSLSIPALFTGFAVSRLAHAWCGCTIKALASSQTHAQRLGSQCPDFCPLLWPFQKCVLPLPQILGDRGANVHPARARDGKRPPRNCRMGFCSAVLGTCSGPGAWGSSSLGHPLLCQKRKREAAVQLGGFLSVEAKAHPLDF